MKNDSDLDMWYQFVDKFEWRYFKVNKNKLDYEKIYQEERNRDLLNE